MLRPPLPDDLLTGTHPRQRWIDAGVSRRELARIPWERVSHGMYAWIAETEHVTGRLHRVGGLAPPGGGLGGWAAAHLLGAGDLDGVTLNGALLPVMLCMPRRQTCRRTPPDVRIWRSDLEPEDLVRIEGTPVTHPTRTGFDLARLDPLTGRAGTGVDATEALVALEALLRTGTTTVGEIGAYATAHPRKAGARQARQLLDEAEPGTRSCQETRLRRLWTMDAALPAPLVNARVADRAGRFVAEVDLLDPDAGLVGEYDGGYHASADRRARDHARVQQLERLGLVVMRVAAPDLTRFRTRTVQRLTALHRQGLSRNRHADGWRLLDRPD